MWILFLLDECYYMRRSVRTSVFERFALAFRAEKCTEVGFDGAFDTAEQADPPFVDACISIAAFE